jgi:hypothetical protein
MKIAQKYYEKQAKNKLEIQSNFVELKKLWEKHKKEYLILMGFFAFITLGFIFLIIMFIN